MNKTGRGQFAKGRSGNPGGRPKAKHDNFTVIRWRDPAPEDGFASGNAWSDGMRRPSVS
jgi:hypothetical protein